MESGRVSPAVFSVSKQLNLTALPSVPLCNLLFHGVAILKNITGISNLIRFYCGTEIVVPH